MNDDILFSFIILTRNRANERLRQCLEAIRSQSMRSENIELILLDYGSNEITQGRLRDLATKFDARHVHVNETGPWNRGRAINLGCQAAQGELFAVSDIDMIHGPTYAAEAWRSYIKAGRGAFYGRAIPKDLPEGAMAARTSRTTFADLGQLATDRPKGMGNVVFSRTLLEKARGWEEEYLVWGCEDSDFHDRAHRSGAHCIELKSGLLHQWHETHDTSPDARRTIGMNRVMYLGCVGRTPVTRTGVFGKHAQLDGHQTFQAPTLSLVLVGTVSIPYIAQTLVSINNGMYPVQEVILSGFTGNIKPLQELSDYPLRSLPHEQMSRILAFLKTNISADVVGFLPAGTTFGEFFFTHEKLGKLLSGTPDVDGFFWWKSQSYTAAHQLVPAGSPDS